MFPQRVGLRNGIVVGPVESNKDAIGGIGKVQVRSLGTFEHTGRSEAHE